MGSLFYNCPFLGFLTPSSEAAVGETILSSMEPWSDNSWVLMNATCGSGTLVLGFEPLHGAGLSYLGD